MNELSAVPAGRPVVFRLWGVVEAYANGERISLGGHREKAMFAGLIAAKGHKIQRETLKSWIWDDEPASAADDMKRCMTNLRRQLRILGFANALTNSDGLCQLSVPEDLVDVHRAMALFMAKKAGDVQAAGLLGQALQLCDGEPLAGLNSRRINSYRMELEKQRLALRIAYYQTEIRLGRHKEHIGELIRLFKERPDDIAVTALTMCAHYFAGSCTDASGVYTRHRSNLEESGISVSPEIEALHTRVLENDLPRDACLFALGKPYPLAGGSLMDTTVPLLMAIRTDAEDAEKVRQTVVQSFGGTGFQTRLADDCLIFVLSPDVSPVQVVRVWMDILDKALRQRVQVGITAGSEEDVCQLARSDYARRVLNGAPSSNVVVAVSDDVYERVTRDHVDATSYRRIENDVYGWVRVPGFSTPPHPQDERPENTTPASGSDGPLAVFHGVTNIGKQTIVSKIKKARW